MTSILRFFRRLWIPRTIYVRTEQKGYVVVDSVARALDWIDAATIVSGEPWAGTVEIEAGTHHLDGALYVPDGVTIKGQGGGARILCRDVPSLRGIRAALVNLGERCRIMDVQVEEK